MREQAMRRGPRQDTPSEIGRCLVVRCDRPACDHIALMNPDALFGASRHWPLAGQSYRFRCRCGHRVTRLSYIDNDAPIDGAASPAALELWF